MNVQEQLDKLKLYFSKDISQKFKVYLTISLVWIILIGYLTWWNGLKSPMLDKSFRWDEWFWFGIVPALSPVSYTHLTLPTKA